MISNRRHFFRQLTGLGGAMMLSGTSFDSWAETEASSVKLTILHTNDTHSHLDPFPPGDRNAGKGGVVNRARLLSQIRQQEENVLLFDAGDIFQGTPYFNLFHGEPEVQSLSMLGYDAITMGNHDFDGGMELFARQIRDHATFPVLVANYDFTNTPLKDIVKPYKLFKVKGLRVGVFGLGIQPKGLIPSKLFGDTVYLDPLQKANEVAAFLRNEEKCSLVICLSHLGFKGNASEIIDPVLAAQSRNIDLIIGGHTHTFLPEPKTYKNLDSKPVIVNQVGFGGINLGRLDFTFDRVSKQVFSSGSNLTIG
ncbi:bifunctional UDP-sugar hydrolase/5'-nucleotidase [Siphonobacter sp. SORGH_AS_1065]|uniref:bifunctional metallophosphatase/5'-nucleotidase n=1 Tax=Siphonobacter sp. SORGH_AS_1065 TaxID=3041795 RepID=UPI0027877183|nr:metallophosphatase [Siphonobacter sp. SORGH_AS_1065]MDQ1089957.1 5'-nucleotidase [Siphonobacter sp. SORGH_AS_1065]